MANYALMGNDISNSAGNGPPNFPFGLTQPAVSAGSVIKDLANGSTYTITNTDGFSYFTSSVALSGANKGFILPLAANNLGRALTFKRNDAAGNENTGGNGIWMTITCQGSDIIDGLYATTQLIGQNSFISLMADAAGSWRVTRCEDFIQSKVTTPTAVPATGVAGDATSMSIPLGTWELSSQLYFLTPSANTSLIATGILTQSGNNFSSRVFADTWNTAYAGGAAAGDAFVSCMNYRLICTAVTTYYAKMYIVYTTGSPTYCVRFTARRFI